MSHVGALILLAAQLNQAPQFQGGTSTLDPPPMPIFAKVTHASRKDGVVHVSWATAGRQLLPNGERTPQGKSFTYTYLGCFAEFNPADAILTQADGKKVVPADAWKRLEVGTVVLVAIDGQEVAKAFLARVKQDTLVIRIEGISLTESAGAK